MQLKVTDRFNIGSRVSYLVGNQENVETTEVDPIFEGCGVCDLDNGVSYSA